MRPDKSQSIRFVLHDVSRERLRMAEAARGDAEPSGSDYDRGRHFALYEVLSLLVQADAFGVDRAAIGLDGVDPERDLLSGWHSAIGQLSHATLAPGSCRRAALRPVAPRATLH
jgi:hypothetical protein